MVNKLLRFSLISLLTMFCTNSFAQAINVIWDFGDEATMNAVMAYSGTTEAGTVKNNGLTLTIEANGATFRNNGNNIQVRNGAVFKVPVQSTADQVSVSGYPGYSKFSIGNSTEALTGDQTYTAKAIDVKNGYVAVTSLDDNNYYYSISVVQQPKPAPIKLVDEAATATFPFDLGTDGQKATFSTGDADYFVNSKVTYGSNLKILDSYAVGGITETRFQPTAQNDPPTEVEAIRFLIQPKAGFALTPSKVSFTTTRYGTDNGLLDIYWQNPDGTTVELAKGVKPARNSETTPYSNLSYDITGATAGEGGCGLLVYLYHLQNGKQIGFSNIKIEGTLNGEEKEVPILGSFTANGVNYIADNIFSADGSNYVGEIEVSKTETMISAENPLTNIEAVQGDLGEITYEGDATKCTVTIPMIATDVSLNYILNVVQKPDYTLTYYSTDGSVVGTQLVEKDAAISEFAYDYSVAPAEEGYKVRGWYEKISGGRKYKVSDIITKDIKLFAYATEIEESSPFKKYNYKLTDADFEPADHEAFNPTGKAYFHDNTHGWAFKNGDTIELLVGTKADIFVTVCRYGAKDGIIEYYNGKDEKLGEVPAYVEGTDGVVQVINYEGEAGKLVLKFVSGGENYVHNVKIVNNAETNYEAEGQWYKVKAGDASSLLDVIDAVNGKNSAADAERAFVFLPNGTYDLGYTVLTSISGNNISFIGESQNGVIIKNKAEKEDEGIGTTATFVNTGKNIYFQDLTLKNELDYYGAQAAGLAGGRAVCLQDKGTNTICKNVSLLSYQDTYYSNNNDMKAYWETSDIHGTVDFICGGGDIRFQDCTLSLEKRNADGSGGRTITAATTTTNFGYVFDGCKVVDLAAGASKADWNFSRTWQNQPIVIFLNTTLDSYAEKSIVAKRWTEKGMNGTNPKQFGEYNTVNEAGNNITPATNTIVSHDKNSYETVLTAEGAANYTYEKMFTDWNPAELAAQAAAPANGKQEGDIISWDAVEGATTYLVEKDGEFLTLTNETSLNVAALSSTPFARATGAKAQTTDAAPVYSVRAANSRGGFGEATLIGESTAIAEVNASGNNVAKTEYYNLAGARVTKNFQGAAIQVQKLNNGQSVAKKVIMK